MSKEKLERAKKAAGIKTDTKLAELIGCNRKALSEYKRGVFSKASQKKYDLILDLLIENSQLKKSIIYGEKLCCDLNVKKMCLGKYNFSKNEVENASFKFKTKYEANK